MPDEPSSFSAVFAHVVDGDTADFTVHLGGGVAITIRGRFFGENAAELHGPDSAAGEAAKQFVEQWALANPRVLLKRSHPLLDKYGRWLCEIWNRAGTESLNALLLESGHAVPLHYNVGMETTSTTVIKHSPGIRMAIADFGGTGVDPASLPPMAAAFTKAAQLHFALPPPYGYGISATIRVASGPHDVQPDEWVIGLLANPDQPGALGYHDQTPGGQPLIKVFPLLDKQDGVELSTTITHEIWETMVDPNCARCAQWSDGKIWAYEVSDAVEATEYLVDGVKISNFVLPPYFEPVTRRTGLKLDWMGLVKKPLQILPGGYGQWFDPNQGWQQVVHQDVGPRAYRKQLRGRASHRRVGFLTT